MNVADFHQAQARRSKWAARAAIFTVALLGLAYTCSY